MFIEQALRQLPDGGHLTFVLPEAVLNVQSHRKIRELIMQTCRIRNLIYLGDVFDKVQCPSIILDLQRTTSGFNTSGMTVMTAEKNFFIQTERDVSSKYFNFTATDEEYQILQKLENPTEMVYLAGNADFALGIVTGDNKKYLTHDNVPGSEPILTGADINRFHISQPDHYIVFAPELYQQTAPEAKYRAHEKLLYRFIGGQLIFAYDNRQMLSLNSCNIVIPRIKGLDTKYILAVLNSRPAQFLFSKKFNSVKILRSHIENIPIPIPSPDIQAQIVHLADMLIHEQVSGTCVYNELDSFICELYGLERNEIAIIRNAV